MLSLIGVTTVTAGFLVLHVAVEQSWTPAQLIYPKKPWEDS